MRFVPKLIAFVQLFGAMLTCMAEVYPEPGFRRVKDKIKFCLRGLATPHLTHEWFQMLSNPALSSILNGHPRLKTKLQRPYLHRDLSVRKRLDVLREHFSFVTRSVAPPILHRIYSSDGLTLTELPIEGVGHYHLQLFYKDRFEKEGEMMVALSSDGGKRMIFTLSFTIIAFNENEKCLFIGGLQGFQIKDVREIVVDITRGMHGLRPKGLLLFTVQQLAAIWGIEKIRAVSNELNIFRDFRLNKKKVVADYDEFWVESDGKIDADKLFTLPPRFIPRPITEIKSNKRGIYRKRYLMLEELASKIASNLRPV